MVECEQAPPKRTPFTALKMVEPKAFEGGNIFSTSSSFFLAVVSRPEQRRRSLLGRSACSSDRLSLSVREADQV